MKHNARLLDAIKLPSSLGSSPFHMGVIVEMLTKPHKSALIEISNEEGVPVDFIITEIEKVVADWEAPQSEGRPADKSGIEQFELGLLFLQNGLVSKAKAAFAEAFRMDPRLAGTLMNLANESAGRSAFEVAIFLYWMILELQPNYQLARENLAITHINQGVAFARHGAIIKAVEEFSAALLLKPTQSTLELGQNNLVAAYTSLGMQFASMKRYQEGMQFFYMALQLNPREEVVRRNLALALTALAASTYESGGLPSDEEFNRFIDMGLSLSEALNAFGATLAGLGRMVEAQDALRKALEVDPRNELARNNLEVLESREMHSELPLGISPLETRGAQLTAVQ